MALLATHMKFALDISPEFGLGSLGEYCAGAVYPDSRYVTGVDRRLTHFEDSPSDPFLPDLSDFRRGWAAHNYYDNQSGPRYSRLLPWPVDDLRQFNHVWCFLTGLKVVEDIESYRSFGHDLALLRDLKSDTRPMGEDTEKIERYYRSLGELYVSQPTFERYAGLLSDWGASGEVCDNVIDSAKQIDSDSNLKTDLLSIYKDVLKGTVDHDGIDDTSGN